MLPVELARAELANAATALEECKGRSHLTTEAWRRYVRARWAVWFTSPITSVFELPYTLLALSLDTLLGFVRSTLLGRALLAGAALAAFSLPIFSFNKYLDDQRRHRVNTAWALIAAIAGPDQAPREQGGFKDEEQEWLQRRSPINAGLASAIETLAHANSDLSYIQVRRAYLWRMRIPERTRLSNADFSYSILAGAKLSYVALSNSSLRGAYLDGADFSRSILTDADLRGAGTAIYPWVPGWEPRHFGGQRGVDFSYAALRGAQLSRVKFSVARFDRAVIAGASFERAFLRLVSFRDADLEGANFAGATLESIDFKGANISGVDFAGAVFRKTELTASIASKTNPPKNLPEGVKGPRICSGDLVQRGDDGKAECNSP